MSIEWFTGSTKLVDKDPAVKLNKKYARFMFNKVLADKIKENHTIPQKCMVGIDIDEKIFKIKISNDGNMKLTMTTLKIMGIHCKPIFQWLADKGVDVEQNKYFEAEYDDIDTITVYYDKKIIESK